MKLVLKKMQSPLKNQNGMVLMVAMIISVVIGLISAGILMTNTNKNKVNETQNIVLSADNVKNALMRALNDKTSWQTTQLKNRTQMTSNPRTDQNPGSNSSSSTASYIEVYDQNSRKITDRNSRNLGFKSNGDSCEVFSANEGNDECPFKYEVRVKSISSASGLSVPTLTATLIFKPRDQKIILNTAIDKYTFDITPGQNSENVAKACVIIGGVFTESTQSCDKLVTNASGSCYEGQSLRGVASTQNCQSVVIPRTDCAPNQFVTGFDSINQAICLFEPPTGPNPGPTAVRCQGNWTLCSAGCGGGQQTYNITTQASNGGAPCEAIEGQIRACNTAACGTVDVNCVGSWSNCSASCGGGTKIYSVSQQQAGNGTICEARHDDSLTCNTQACVPGPVNCVGSFGACQGPAGTQYRVFTISRPASNGGANCAYANGFQDPSNCNSAPMCSSAPPMVNAYWCGTCTMTQREYSGGLEVVPTGDPIVQDVSTPAEEYRCTSNETWTRFIIIQPPAHDCGTPPGMTGVRWAGWNSCTQPASGSCGLQPTVTQFWCANCEFIPTDTDDYRPREEYQCSGNTWTRVGIDSPTSPGVCSYSTASVSSGWLECTR